MSRRDLPLEVSRVSPESLTTSWKPSVSSQGNGQPWTSFLTDPEDRAKRPAIRLVGPATTPQFQGAIDSSSDFRAGTSRTYSTMGTVGFDGVAATVVVLPG